MERTTALAVPQMTRGTRDKCNPESCSAMSCAGCPYDVKVKGAREQRQEERAKKYDAVMDSFICYCYVCKKYAGESQTRIISARVGLAICVHCDVDVPEKPVQGPQMARTTRPARVLPGSATCRVCGKPVIDDKKVTRQAEQLERIDLTKKDRERLLQQVKEHGWRYLGNNLYAHNRCCSLKRKR